MILQSYIVHLVRQKGKSVGLMEGTGAQRKVFEGKRLVAIASLPMYRLAFDVTSAQAFREVQTGLREGNWKSVELFELTTGKARQCIDPNPQTLEEEIPTSIIYK